MADHHEVISNAPGFGRKITDSIKGILFGVVIFIAAFPLLWWGEGRQNLAELVKEAQMVASDATPSVENEALIKTSGKLSSSESVADTQFLTSLGNAKALQLNRNVEMYAWKENKKTTKKGDKNVTTYDYVKTWTSRPADSAKFYDSKTHRNPRLTINGQTFKVSEANVGALAIDMGQARFWGTKSLSVTEDMVNKSYESPIQVASGNMYLSYDKFSTRKVHESPKIGDIKISYNYFPSDVDGAVVGSWTNAKISPYFYDDTDSFLGVYPGTLKAFQGALQSEHTMMSWIIRVASFLMMWIGLNLILGPILVVMDSIPLVGGAGKAVISLVTGVIAFVLWLLTFILANLWLVLLVMAVIGVGVMVFLKKKKPQTVAYET